MLRWFLAVVVAIWAAAVMGVSAAYYWEFPHDPNALLHVTRDASDKDIKRSFRELTTRRLHRRERDA
jgi:preprotein translocase subunit Sec63